MIDLPHDAAGSREHFFASPGSDEMMSMLLELASEVWVMRERLYAHEAVMAAQGGTLRELVEAWKPTPAQHTELADLRKAYLQSLFRALAPLHAAATA